MSTKLYKEIYCDNCKAKYQGPTFPANKVNAKARADGWRQTGGKDYCPSCQTATPQPKETSHE